MKKPIFNLFLFFTSCLILLITLQGCTIAGYTYGKSLNNKRINSEVIRVENLARANIGDSVRAVTRDNNTIRAKFDGVHQKSPEEYKNEYKNFFGPQSKKNIPALGDSILISTKRGLEKWLTFDGFDYSILWLKSIKKDAKSFSVQYETIKQINRRNGGRLTGQELTLFAEAGHLPIKTYIRFEREDNEIRVQPTEIVQIELLPQNNKAEIIGTLIGFCLDILIVSYFVPTYYESPDLKLELDLDMK